MKQGFQTALAPDISGAIRYERIAQLEAVRSLRQNKRRRMKWQLIGVCGFAIGCLMAWLMW